MNSAVIPQVVCNISTIRRYLATVHNLYVTSNLTLNHSPYRYAVRPEALLLSGQELHNHIIGTNTAPSNTVHMYTKLTEY